MKTAVSIPDDVFDQAEKLARLLKKSRSQFYADALNEYLARHAPDAITESMNEVVDEIDTHCDPFVTEASLRTLNETEW